MECGWSKVSEARYTGQFQVEFLAANWQFSFFSICDFMEKIQLENGRNNKKKKTKTLVLFRRAQFSNPTLRFHGN
jgi:hypothetical protein